MNRFGRKLAAVRAQLCFVPVAKSALERVMPLGRSTQRATELDRAREQVGLLRCQLLHALDAPEVRQVDANSTITSSESRGSACIKAARAIWKA